MIFLSLQGDDKEINVQTSTYHLQADWGGGIIQIFFLFQDLKICTSFFDVQFFYLFGTRSCTFRFHPL